MMKKRKNLKFEAKCNSEIYIDPFPFSDSLATIATIGSLIGFLGPAIQLIERHERNRQHPAKIRTRGIKHINTISDDLAHVRADLATLLDVFIRRPNRHAQLWGTLSFEQGTVSKVQRSD